MSGHPLALPADCLPPIYLGSYSGVEALAIGLSMSLWGATCMQMFLYFTIGFKDRPLLRATVIFTWIMTTVNEFALLGGLYMNVVTGDILTVGASRIEFFSEYLLSPLWTAVVGFATQSLFTYRIYKFSNNLPVTAALVFGVLLQLVSGVALFIVEICVKLGSPILPSQSKVIVIATLVLSAVVDLSLSAVLCFFMWNAAYLKGGSRLGSTTSMLYTITVVTVNSGFWTAACASAVAVLAAVFTENLLFFALTFLLAPLYCNSLLGSLNARIYARSPRTVAPTNIMQLSTIKIHNPVSDTCETSTSALTTSFDAENAPSHWHHGNHCEGHGSRVIERRTEPTGSQ